jgi:hypothetical protein
MVAFGVSVMENREGAVRKKENGERREAAGEKKKKKTEEERERLGLAKPKTAFNSGGDERCR